MTEADLEAAAPALILAASAIVLMAAALPRRVRLRALAWLGALLAVVAATAAIALGPGPAGFTGTLARDGASVVLAALIAIVTAANLALMGADPRHARRAVGGDVALVLFSASGAALMVAATDLLVLFAGMALLSLPLYVLTGRRHGQAGLRYLLLGAAIGAVTIYGIALLYTATGESGYASLGRATRNPLYLAGLALALAGLAFHAGLLPFSVWAPATHQTAPPAISTHLAIVAKIAAFGGLLRLIAATGSGDAGLDWEVSLAVLAALTIAVGALSAITERRVKRLLAYLAMMQAGYIAIAAAGQAAPAAAFYLAVDAALIGGAFAVLVTLPADDPSLDDLAGLARQRPLLVLGFGVLLMGLIGLPPTAGFLAKLYVFEAAARAQLLWLIVVGALATVLSAVACARLLLACFAPPRLDAIAPARARVATTLVLAAAVVAIAVGVVPGPLLDAAQAVRF
jgi:NADH-quinone oxidoreductase subunit N